MLQWRTTQARILGLHKIVMMYLIKGQENCWAGKGKWILENLG